MRRVSIAVQLLWLAVLLVVIGVGVYFLARLINAVYGGLLSF